MLDNAFICLLDFDEADCLLLPKCGSHGECPRKAICRTTTCPNGPDLCAPLCPD